MKNLAYSLLSAALILPATSTNSAAQVASLAELVNPSAEASVDANELGNEGRERECFECDVRVSSERARTLRCEERAPGKLVRSFFTARLAFPRISDAGEVLVPLAEGVTTIGIYPIQDNDSLTSVYPRLAPYERECLDLLAQKAYGFDWQTMMLRLADKALQACLSPAEIKCQADAECSTGGRGACPARANLREVVGLLKGEESADSCAKPAAEVRTCDRIYYNAFPNYSISLTRKERRGDSWVYTCSSDAGEGTMGLEAKTVLDRCGVCRANCPTID